MKVGLRGRLFFVSVALILVAGSTSAVFLEHELRQWLANRIEEELLGHASAALGAVELAQDARSQADFDALADSLGRYPGHRISLIGRSGEVLGDSAIELERLSTLENHGSRKEVVDALALGKGSDRRQSTTVGAWTLYVAIPFEHPHASGVLRVAAPLKLVDDTVQRMRVFLLIAGALGLTLAVFMSVLASHLLSRRLHTLLVRARAMADGHGQRPKNPDNVDEIAVLHHSLDRLDLCRQTIQHA